MLTSGGQLRLPPPPDEAATAAELQQLRALPPVATRPLLIASCFWDAGAPGYRWNGILADELFKRNLFGATSSRQWPWCRSRSTTRPSPRGIPNTLTDVHAPASADPALATAVATPRSPSYPSEHAAVAGAAARVLAYLFPDRGQALTAQADEAARSRELAGVQYPSDTAAGLELGRKVADLVIERARHDGSEVPWTGSVPTEPGKWSLRALPRAGRLPSGPRSAPTGRGCSPPAASCGPAPRPRSIPPEKAAEVAEVVNFPRTFLTSAAAFYWQTPKGTTTHWMLAADQKIFEYRLDTNPPRAARVQALMSVASYDAAVACWDAKYTYWAMRPFHYDPRFTPLIPVPAHPSYPAAHGCYSGSAAAVLAVSLPARRSSPDRAGRRGGHGPALGRHPFPQRHPRRIGARPGGGPAGGRAGAGRRLT